MNYALAAALIILGAYAQARNERAKRAEERLRKLERLILSGEFMVTRSWDAPTYNLAELPEFHDENRPS